MFNFGVEFVLTPAPAGASHLRGCSGTTARGRLPYVAMVTHFAITMPLKILVSPIISTAYRSCWAQGVRGRDEVPPERGSTFLLILRDGGEISPVSTARPTYHQQCQTTAATSPDVITYDKRGEPLECIAIPHQPAGQGDLGVNALLATAGKGDLGVTQREFASLQRTTFMTTRRLRTAPPTTTPRHQLGTMFIE